MSDAPAGVLAPQRRARLERLLEVALPAAGTLPSGRQALLARGALERALTVRPDLAEPLAELVDRLDPEAGVDALDRLEGHDAFVWMVAIGGAYLLDPDVRFQLRADERPPLPDQDVAELEALVAPVIARGGPR